MQISDREAVDYAGAYVGSFSFLVSIRDQVRAGKRLSPGQLAAVKNCMLRDAGRSTVKNTYVTMGRVAPIDTNSTAAAATRSLLANEPRAVEVEADRPGAWMVELVSDEEWAARLVEIEKLGPVGKVTRRSGPRSKDGALAEKRAAKAHGDAAMMAQGLSPAEIERHVRAQVARYMPTGDADWDRLCVESIRGRVGAA